MGKKMNNPYELVKNILQSVSDESQPIPANEGFRSIDLYGSSAHGKNENEDTFNRFHLENESGVGDITLYQVFPGIELVYNDMPVTINFSKITEEMKKILELLNVDLGRIQELSRMQEFVIVRANATIEHIIRRHRLKLSSRFIHF